MIIDYCYYRIKLISRYRLRSLMLIPHYIHWPQKLKNITNYVYQAGWKSTLKTDIHVFLQLPPTDLDDNLNLDSPKKEYQESKSWQTATFWVELQVQGRFVSLLMSTSIRNYEALVGLVLEVSRKCFYLDGVPSIRPASCISQDKAWV